MNRENEIKSWKINMYGFLNFWLFADEQIKTANGNLLLTGENGSGKSVTLQSFIPLILDGNTKSNRLSTEGDMSRKIEDYLLFGNKEYNTSYLYIEFIKGDKYLTFGIGFKARNGKRPEQWYFKIEDKRVGKDIKFYNKTREAYNKKELKPYLERVAKDRYKIFDTQEEYKNAVNKSIFGFENIDEFDETLKLLFELRKPSLKDASGFDPKYIYEILNASLQTLPTEELQQMSGSFQNMENISIELKNLLNKKNSMDEVEKVYKKYNEVTLHKYLSKYIESYNEDKSVKKDLKERKEIIKKLDLDIENNKKRIINLKIKAENLRKEKMELENSHNLQDIRNRILRIKDEIDERQREQEYLKTEVKNLEKRIKEREIKEEKEDQEYKNEYKRFCEKIEKLKEVGKGLSFIPIIEYDEFLDMKLNRDLIVIKSEFSRYKKALNCVGQKRKQVEKIELILDGKLFDRNFLDLEILELDRKIGENKEKFVEKKEILSEKISVLNFENTYLYLNNDQVGDIEEIIFEKEEEYDPFKGKEYISSIYNLENLKFYREQDGYKLEISFIEKEKKEVEKKIKKLEGETDIELPRKNPLKANESRWQEFYKTIKFKNGVDQQVKNKVEESLFESGILDSLVDGKNNRNGIEVFDKFLIPKKRYLKNLMEYIEVEDKILGEDKKYIEETLSSISIVESDEFYISPAGKYKIGIIEGNSRGVEGAKYIGIKERQRLKEQKIIELKNDLESLKNKFFKLELSIDKIDEKKEILKKEFESLKELLNSKKIKEIESLILKFVREKELKNIILTNLISNIEKENKNKNMLEIEINKILNKYDIVVDDFSRLEVDLGKYERKLIELDFIYTSLNKSYENIKYLKNDLEVDIQSRKEKTQKRNKEEQKIRELGKTLKEVENILKGNDMKAVLLRLDSIQIELGEVPQKIEKRTKNILNNEVKINNNKEKIRKQEEESKIIEKKLFQWSSIIDAELLNNFLEFEETFDAFEDKVRLKDRMRKRIENFREETIFSLNSKVNKKLSQKFMELKGYNLEFVDYTYLFEKKEKIEIEEFPRRHYILGRMSGRVENFKKIRKNINEEYEFTKGIFGDEEKKFYEDMLFNEIGREINTKIKEAKDWVKKIGKIMEEVPTSSNKSYSLKWEPMEVDKKENLKADEFVRILGNKYSKDVDKVKRYFQEKTKQLQQENNDKGKYTSSYEIIKKVLDYREWYSFSIKVKDSDGRERKLDKKLLNKYSGGEKSMAMYIPLFSALYARYNNARSDSLKLVVMDEAFSVVDDENIEKLFHVLEYLDMNYLLASQKLSGTYKTVKDLAIVTIENALSKRLVDNSEDAYVCLLKYIWNGKRKEKDLRDVHEVFEV